MINNHNFYDLQFDLNVNCYFIKHVGELNYDSLMSRSAAIYQHPLFVPHINSIIDFRDCTLNLSSEDLKRGAETIRKRILTRGTAKELLFVRDQFSYGVTREYLARIDTGSLERKIYTAGSGFGGHDVKQFLNIEDSYKFPDFLVF